LRFEADLPRKGWPKAFFVESASMLWWETPSNLSFVPADLEAQELASRLAAHGFEREAGTFCSVLGVTQYLSREAVEILLRFGASLPRHSEIVSSFVPPDDE
jgi:O-methyltransferase involved in polyketide biosynthesis